MRKIAMGAILLLLAGCQIPIPERANETLDDAGFNMVNAGDPVPSGVDDSSRNASTALNGRIPPAFQGRWGLVAADCTSTRGDNKGLMTVEADRLSFYESRASIAKIEALSPTELRATLAFTGEGQEWTEETPLVLEDNGNVLTRIAEGQSLRYTRCGA